MLRTLPIRQGTLKGAQAAAPSNVLLSNLTIEGVQRVPLYLSPGVTRVTIENSKFIGNTVSTVIYLDAESAYNTIRNNTFNVEGSSTFRVREVIAVDGSAHNQITDNTFEKAVGGGVYLYRNCGEGGTVRHQSPQYNVIEDNNFNLTGLNWGNYGIWLLQPMNTDNKTCSQRNLKCMCLQLMQIVMHLRLMPKGQKRQIQDGQCLDLSPQLSLMLSRDISSLV
jgi:hypothetical protein